MVEEGRGSGAGILNLVEYQNPMESVKNPNVQAAFQINGRMLGKLQNSLSTTRDRRMIPKDPWSLSLLGRTMLQGPCLGEEPSAPILVGFMGLNISAKLGGEVGQFT